MNRLISYVAISSCLVFLAGLLFAAQEEVPATELSGLLELRFNDCFNPNRQGPETDVIVRDSKSRKETVLNLAPEERANLKYGRVVQLKGRFKEDAKHSGRGKPFQVTELTYEAAAEGDSTATSGAKAPDEGAGDPASTAPAVTYLDTLVIHANTLDTTVDSGKVTSISNLLFEGTQNVGTAMEHASFGHYELLEGPTIIVDVNINAVGTDYEAMVIAMVDAAAVAGYDVGDYDRYVVCCPNGTESGGTTDWSAWGYYGSSGKTVWSYDWTGEYFDALLHEMGHNFGFRHSGLSGNSYGDRTCVMGYSHSSTASTRYTATYGAVKKTHAGWYGPYPGSHTSLTSDATFDLYPISQNPDDAPGMRGVQLGGTDYYISYRRYLPPYGWLNNSGDADKVYVHTNQASTEACWRVGDLTSGSTYDADGTSIIFERYGNSAKEFAAVSFDFPDGNTKPTADAQAPTVYKDTPAAMTLTGDDVDVGDTLSYSIYIPPIKGSISGTPPNITYTPTNGYTGPDSFVFKVSDGKISSFAVVSFTVVTSPTTVNHSVPYSWLVTQDSSWSDDFELAATNDHDGDGVSTAYEYWSGTDPTNAESFLRIGDIVWDASNVRLIWSHSNVIGSLPPLRIESRPSLLTGNWSFAAESTPSNGVNAWDDAAAPGLFYRLAVTNVP